MFVAFARHTAQARAHIAINKQASVDYCGLSSQVAYKMFFLVKILTSGEKVILPKKWVEGLSLTKFFNNGIAYFKNKEFKVFVSLNPMDGEPEFQSIILAQIDRSRPSCYMAKVLKCFG